MTARGSQPIWLPGSGYYLVSIDIGHRIEVGARRYLPVGKYPNIF